MRNHDRYVQAHQHAPFYFSIKSDCLIEDIKWIEQNNIENIRLCGFEPYNIDSIEVLSRINGCIKRLSIYIKDADLRGLRQYDSIIELSIGEVASNIDLTGLGQLEELYLLYSKWLEGFETLQKLKRLTVVKVEPSFFRKEYGHIFEGLAFFQLLSGRLPEDSSLIPLKRSLCSLELYGIKSPIELTHLLKDAKNLEELRIEKCRKVLGLELVLPSLTALSLFSLIDSGLLFNSSFVQKMPLLETLIVLGSSYFIDGNLEELKKLKWAIIDNKRHYNLRNEDLPKNG